LSLFYYFYHRSIPVPYALPLHDALPILAERLQHPALAHRAVGTHRADAEMAVGGGELVVGPVVRIQMIVPREAAHEVDLVLVARDRKSTRLNSSHVKISYAVFCLEKKTS